MSVSALAVFVLLNQLQKYGNETNIALSRGRNDTGDPALSGMYIMINLRIGFCTEFLTVLRISLPDVSNSICKLLLQLLRDFNGRLFFVSF